ncbi:type II toxin-antitoxin system prevent-host-death family antitoxin [Nguyenibacter sp. L1]|uniref:type II toxin-antitoxin system Phd/YefM family antitoxin n=1 Tax=Nguyenibacter sp. L1 TaxID=3049350 RepID=UPI002B48E431|nr:type II toxin-antitoxin system prevent-host-death family antitoxin [Nguyenibacter sp. L1]WRH87560.1 type II toxin-antitoxin system prevent-host-death family antitoxin [Nguyenibacter sp. L1]
MRTFNIHEAKTHLSRLIDDASKGESFIIAKAGRPVARVSPVSAPTARRARRLGFLAGELQVPDDFDHMGQEAIRAAFEGRP